MGTPMKPLRVFIGTDDRQPLAFTVCASSILRHAKKRVAIEKVGPDWIPGFTRNGLTTFTFRRYLVPWLCGYKGTAIFMDGDIIVSGDVNELATAADSECAVSVAKHVARFEWPSVMVFQNDKCRALTFEHVNDPASKPHALGWSDPIGTLPPEWNHCVGYEPHREDAKLVHFTAGLPCWPETEKCPHAEKWREELNYALSTVSWYDLMSTSVHAELVLSGKINEKR